MLFRPINSATAGTSGHERQSVGDVMGRDIAAPMRAVLRHALAGAGGIVFGDNPGQQTLGGMTLLSLW